MSSTLSRRELQALCKQHGIKANGKNVEMVAALRAILGDDFDAPTETALDAQPAEEPKVVVENVEAPVQPVEETVTLPEATKAVPLPEAVEAAAPPVVEAPASPKPSTPVKAKLEPIAKPELDDEQLMHIASLPLDHEILEEVVSEPAAFLQATFPPSLPGTPRPAAVATRARVVHSPQFHFSPAPPSIAPAAMVASQSTLSWPVVPPSQFAFSPIVQRESPSGVASAFSPIVDVARSPAPHSSPVVVAKPVLAPRQDVMKCVDETDENADEWFAKRSVAETTPTPMSPLFARRLATPAKHPRSRWDESPRATRVLAFPFVAEQK